MAYYITVGSGGQVREIFNTDDGESPLDAVAITANEFTQIQGGNNFFKYENGAVSIDADAETEAMRKALMMIERERAIEELMLAKKTQIDAMNKTALESAIKNGGI